MQDKNAFPTQNNYRNNYNINLGIDKKTIESEIRKIKYMKMI